MLGLPPDSFVPCAPPHEMQSSAEQMSPSPSARQTRSTSPSADTTTNATDSPRTKRPLRCIVPSVERAVYDARWLGHYNTTAPAWECVILPHLFYRTC